MPVVENVRCAWAQEWVDYRDGLVTGYSLHEDRAAIVPRILDLHFAASGDPVLVEVGFNEAYDKTFHRRMLESSRVLVNPPEATAILRRMKLGWDGVLDLADGMWNQSGSRGLFHPKISLPDCSETSLERWKNPTYNGSFQPEVKYGEEAALVARLRKDRGSSVVKFVKERTSPCFAFFARASYEDLVKELLVRDVMES